MSLSYQNLHVEEFARAVATYLRPHRKNLNSYQWPMQDSCIAASEKLNLLPRSALGNSIAATDRLRQAVAQRVRDIQSNAHLLADERSTQLQTMAHFAIVEWGGLGSNRQETLRAYVERFIPVGLQLDEVNSYQLLKQQVPSKRARHPRINGCS